MASSSACRGSFYDEQHNHTFESSDVGSTIRPWIRIILRALTAAPISNVTSVLESGPSISLGLAKPTGS